MCLAFPRLQDQNHRAQVSTNLHRFQMSSNKETIKGLTENECLIILAFIGQHGC